MQLAARVPAQGGALDVAHAHHELGAYAAGVLLKAAKPHCLCM